MAGLAEPDAESDAETERDCVSGSELLDAVVPTVSGRGGHPALILRRLFSSLARCSMQPEGARTVLRSAATRRLEVSDPGCISDVDDPAAARAVAATAEVA
jgi:CTP:molybdopterin cytidylyltransferase MocA